MRKPSRKDLALVVLSFLIATGIVGYSANVQRYGPELGVFGNVCGPSGNELCYEPLLNGGLPLPYFFDDPGISVRGALHFAEDRIRVVPFMLDVVLIGAFLSLVVFIGRAHLRRNTPN